MRRFIILEDIQVLGLSSSASSIPNSIYIQRFIPTSRSLFSILSLSLRFISLSFFLSSLRSPSFSLSSFLSTIFCLFYIYSIFLSSLYFPSFLPILVSILSSLSSLLFSFLSFISPHLSSSFSLLRPLLSNHPSLSSILSLVFVISVQCSDGRQREKNSRVSHFMNQSNEGGDEGGGRVENKEEEELEGRRVGMGERGEEACRGIE